MSERNGPRRVGLSAERVAARLGLPSVSAHQALIELWPACAALAEVSTLVGMREGSIVVEVSDPRCARSSGGAASRSSLLWQPVCRPVASIATCHVGSRSEGSTPAIATSPERPSGNGRTSSDRHFPVVGFTTASPDGDTRFRLWVDTLGCTRRSDATTPAEPLGRSVRAGEPG